MYDQRVMRNPKRIAVAALWASALALPQLASAQTDLERARAFYNAGQFDESIAAATTASSRPAMANSARLIIARARLERFRRLGEPKELDTARSELISLKPSALAPQEAIEWQIGVGTALFLEDQLGPAAEAFATLLPSARTRLTPEEFQKLLEESLTGNARTRIYENLRVDSRSELERNPFSRAATYWAVVASRGAGDLDAAWNAAVAGWIRMNGQIDGQQIQTDIDTFVTRTLIPERAQARTSQRLDAKATIAEIAALNDEWRAIAARWSPED
jgi:hypothetical protein